MRRYGQWAGNEKGWPEVKSRCLATVSRGWHSAQCFRPRGHGKDGTLCRQHAKMEAAGSNLWIPPDKDD